jgi:hypothetical protein
MNNQHRVQILASLAVLEGVLAGMPGVMWQRMAILAAGMVMAFFCGRMASK